MDISDRIRFRKFVASLRQHLLIKQVKIHFNSIDVIFTTGITERWLMSSGRLFDSRRYEFTFEPGESEPVPIRTQFETEPGDPDEALKRKHPMIMFKEFKKACFVERRLAIQRFITEVLKGGWQKLWYPQEALSADLQRLVNTPQWRHWTPEDELHAVPALWYRNKAAPGRIILEHFNELSCLPGAKGTYIDGWKPKYLYRTCLKLLASKVDITRSAATRLLNSTLRFGPKVVTPGAYLCLLRRFGLQPAVVVDFKPGFGAKLLASAAAGARIYLVRGEVPSAIQRMADFLGVVARPFDGQPCDVAFADDDLKPFEGEDPAVDAEHLFLCTKIQREGVDNFPVVVVPHAVRRVQGILPHIMLHLRPRTKIDKAKSDG